MRVKFSSSRSSPFCHLPKRSLVTHFAMPQVHIGSRGVAFTGSASRTAFSPRDSSGTAKSQKCAVLVVDDQSDVREMLREYLTFCGLDVHEACDGLEAIDVAVR